MAIEAIWNDQVIAHSDDTVVVEGNHYFPKEDVDTSVLEKSSTTSVCPWKGTANYYTIDIDGERNEDAAWLWQAGDPLLLSLSSGDAGPVREVKLGADVIAGDAPQVIVQPDEWQAATPLPGREGYSLVSCIVSPAFEFAGFTLAEPDWHPGRA